MSALEEDKTDFRQCMLYTNNIMHKLLEELKSIKSILIRIEKELQQIGREQEKVSGS